MSMRMRMRMRAYPYYLYPLFVLLLLIIISGVTSDESEKVLLKLKAALAAQSGDTKVLDSWRTNASVCSFTGIRCDETGSVVKEIELSHQNLRGSVPFDSICQLHGLEKLSLGFNYLQGPVTHHLNKCSRLTYLDLGNNLFSGPMPRISSMNNLLYLYINNTGLSGSFPWSSLESMTGLVVLSVGDNPFDQTPFPQQLLQLTNLTWLYMSNCSITGQIPAAIGELKELVNLEVSTNYITGEIPSGISQLLKLRQLELYDNNLTGKLPPGLANLTNLHFLDASMNHLQGHLSQLKFLTQLKSLQMFDNHLTGEIPPEIGHFKQLLQLSLYRNHLTGTLPQQLGSWSPFIFIDVSENLLTGTIPPNMCKNHNMTHLLMLDNNFTGPIPPAYAHCKTLSRFRVSNNMLSGVVPGAIWGLPNAVIIDIANNNQLEGSITSDIQNAKTLGQILAAHNRLSGDLPPEISKATSLNTIDLSHNRFSGRVPATIGELKHLDSLHLDNNNFTGEIPDSLGSCDSLSDINMAYNSFSGEIPAALGWLPTLNSLNLSSNQLSGGIPGSLSSARLSLLDLSHNKLGGAIPESLSVEAYNGSFVGNPGLCSQKVKYFRPCSSSSGGGGVSSVMIIRTVITIGSAVGLFLLAYLCYVSKKKKKISRGKEDEYSTWNVKSFHVLSFTEDEIMDSIKEENLIGKGGSGQVYRVSLKNGMELAVKHMIRNTDSASGLGLGLGLGLGWGKSKKLTTRYSSSSSSSSSREFEAEVETLSSIRHVNVVKLYCSITSQGQESRLLVYEYLANGSLWDRLHDPSKKKKLGGLDWITRYEIAVGAAKGLEYLHHGCERPVIHRDVKSSNILLDEHLKPRIADFGLAKMGRTPAADTSYTHVIAGTHGYIAPEYGYTYKVDEKSDVYSFGVVLMELVTGKKPIEVEYGENKDIVYWVCSKLKNKESVLSLVDSSIGEAYKEETVKVLKIAIMCTSRLPTLRPTMRAVLKMLEEAQPCKLISLTKDKQHY